MIKKLDKIKPKKGEDPKVMCDKNESLKVKYQDQAKVLDNNTIMMHLLLVCTKLCKFKLMQTQVESEANDKEITYKSLMRHINTSWRIKSSGEGVAQLDENKVVLINMVFKGKCHTCGKCGHKQSKCPEKNKSKEEKGNKKFTGKYNHCSKMGRKVANCWELEANKDKRPKN